MKYNKLLINKIIYYNKTFKIFPIKNLKIQKCKKIE
jgi:ribosomal protein S3AE